MRKSKRPRFHSPPGEQVQGEGVNSVGSGGNSPNPAPDNPNLRYPMAGKIVSLHMENFMCHSNLEVTFDKRITFVTGMNGSGKSAIMAALVVALGGSAHTTGRGVGLSDFIKKGSTWARVTITLNNEGVNSYKRHIYGKRIVIIRSFSKNSSSSYICKSESGEVTSRKKDEVDKIVTVLDLQIKNPICILNQDVARSFLSTSDNSMRYSMFMKATHLEDIKQIYSETSELLSNSQKDLEEKMKAIAEATKEINNLKEKLAYFASLENMKKEKAYLENEYHWSLVAVEEESMKNLMNKRKEIEGREREFSQKEKKVDEIMKKLMQDIKEIQEKIAGFRDSQSDKRMKKRELQAKIQNLQRQIDNLNMHLRQLVVKSERQQSEINSIKEHLQKNEELTSQSQVQREKLADQLKQLRQDLLSSRERLEATQRDSDNAMETKLQHTIALESLKTDLSDLERSKRILEVQVERTANAGDNTLLKYGPFTPKLKELIDEADKRHQFQKKPVGICGLYVTLSGENKWARAVESVVGGLMSAYCCDNQKDFQVLSHLMDRICGGKNPSIIISKFQNSRYNISSKKVSVSGLQSVFDVLHFNNDVVFNTFIDQARIETILLFETDAQAASLLTHIQNVPKNLRMGLTLQSDQYYPAPNYRTYYGDRNRSLKYFDTPKKSKAAKDELDGEVQKTNLAIKEKKMEIAELTNKLAKVIDFIKKTESNLRLFKQNERKIEADINHLKNEEQSCPVAPTRLVLEEELVALEKNQAEVQAKIDQDKKSLEVLLKNKEELVRKLDEVVKSEDDLSEEVSVLEQKLEEAKEKLSDEKNKKGILNNKITAAKYELSDVIGEIKEKNKLLTSKIKNASKVHKERIKTERTPAEIQKLLEKCSNYIEAAGKNVDQKEEITNEYKIKLKKFKEIKSTADFMEQVVNSLTDIVICKRDNFRTVLNHTASLITFHFQACLQTRGYNGQLKFDFKNQTLDIEVTAKDGVVRKDTKTLSGGERSYSTVSFILAIWRAVRMPFYFLDEFDVFMDKVNRKVIMDLLLEYAKLETKMQFIFITPQDISNIHSSDCISIYRMPDPRK